VQDADDINHSSITLKNDQVAANPVTQHGAVSAGQRRPAPQVDAKFFNADL
jgi:hypothetical protein